VGKTGKKIKRKIQKARRYILYLLTLFGLKLCKLLPYNFSLKAGSFLGSITFLIFRKLRKITIDNLSIAFGDEMSDHEIKNLACEVFKEQGKNAFEIFKILEISSEKLSKYVNVEGLENLDEALTFEKGVVFITAHMGNWELLAMSFAQLGYPSNPFIRKINNEYIDELLNNMRRKFGIKPINRDGIQAVKAGLKVLRRKEILGILIDQDTTRVEGVFVDFFGRLAYTPSGAATLAIAAKCPVIFSFISRQEDNKHLIKVSKVFHPIITGDKKKDILTNTQYFTKQIEKVVRENPSQWVFMHRRWRHTPDNLDL